MQIIYFHGYPGVNVYKKMWVKPNKCGDGLLLLTVIPFLLVKHARPFWVGSELIAPSVLTLSLDPYVFQIPKHGWIPLGSVPYAGFDISLPRICCWQNWICGPDQFVWIESTCSLCRITKCFPSCCLDFRWFEIPTLCLDSNSVH